MKYKPWAQHFVQTHLLTAFETLKAAPLCHGPNSRHLLVILIPTKAKLQQRPPFTQQLFCSLTVSLEAKPSSSLILYSPSSILYCFLSVGMGRPGCGAFILGGALSASPPALVKHFRVLCYYVETRMPWSALLIASQRHRAGDADRTTPTCHRTSPCIAPGEKKKKSNQIKQKNPQPNKTPPSPAPPPQPPGCNLG